MTPTDFSVLLLAWDDVDPGVAVLGGSALPPTLPLVYQLAARHPVLAVFPHLPTSPAEAVAGAPGTVSAAGATPALAWPEPGVIPNPLEADANGPGVRLLPAAPSAGSPPLPASASGSRLVGLDDLLPAIQGALPTSHSLTLAPSAAPRRVTSAGRAGAATLPATPARSQWPAHSGPAATSWLAPAAPYAGADSAVAAQALPVADDRGTARVREAFPPPPPAPPRPGDLPLLTAANVAEAPDALATPGAAGALASSTGAPMPASSAADSDTVVPAAFDEPVQEMGAAEASDLDAPEDDLVPDAAPPAAATNAASATAATAVPEPAATWAVRQPTLDGLNFRMIQYARQAAQLVDGQQNFDVIYAPGWPAWLAALEIRNRSGRPLVLYVPALASDTAPAAERGWLLGLERMTLRRATLVLVPDADVLRQLRASHAEALGEVRIVPAADEAAVQQVLAEVALG